MTSDIVTYIRLEPDGPLPAIEAYAPFKAVVVLEGMYSRRWQGQVSRWLIDNGCRYMLAWGSDCKDFHDAVDHASIMKHLPEETPNHEFVMTTWHENETLADVFWQAQFNAQFSYDDIELVNALIVHISETDRSEWMKALFERSKTLAEREPD